MAWDVVLFLLRWLHVVAAIAAAGGLIFMRLVLVPAAAAGLSDEQRQFLHAGVRSRWAKIVMLCIFVLLVTGLTNYLLLIRTARETWPAALPKSYHMIFGFKFLLALVVFFISSALVGRSPALERFRKNAKFWMSVNLALVLTVVALSSVLRMTHTGPNPDRPRESAPRTG